MKTWLISLLAMLSLLATGCSKQEEQTMEQTQALNNIAEQYVKLILDVGHHHPYYIDAYYGPEKWKDESTKKPLDELLIRNHDLVNQLAATQVDASQALRKQFLDIQLKSVDTFIRLQQGEKILFDDESLGLYDALSPTITEQELDAALAELSLLIPGEGELNQRLNTYKSQFVIPLDKLDTVFNAAIDEARKRTKAHIDLPENESFTIEYVTDKVWSGYNWYKGNNFSLIQLNTDFPIYIERAIDLASHEGYPGHHVFNSQMEQHLVDKMGWIEYSIYPLYSPMSLLAEGSANYGIEVAFPKDERLAFEKEVLFPLAGLDATQVNTYYQVQDKLALLSYADNMIAKRYLDGDIDKEAAIDLLMKYALSSQEKSTQRIGFIEAHRAYVINYNLGQDLVKQYVDRVTGEDDLDKRWAIFADLLAYPKTASMMAE
ncbi:hypothetical protein ACFSJY_14285 [Thalassotalea euphylliae]|uniref:hypothetical protein n=1 Tax=Thalassotalea euphylliae TaxID=1655234 RepID=UPI00364102AA